MKSPVGHVLANDREGGRETLDGLLHVKGTYIIRTVYIKRTMQLLKGLGHQAESVKIPKSGEDRGGQTC